ncbi:hypothetical protein STEG23_016526 [Scotinomys teguina]
MMLLNLETFDVIETKLGCRIFVYKRKDVIAFVYVVEYLFNYGSVSDLTTKATSWLEPPGQAKSRTVVHTGFELMTIFPLQPLECLDYRGGHGMELGRHVVLIGRCDCSSSKQGCQLAAPLGGTAVTHRSSKE